MTQAPVAPAKTRAQIPDTDAAQGPLVAAPAITAMLLTIWVTYATVHVFIGHWY